MKTSDYAEFSKFWEGACELFPTKPPSREAVFLAFSALAAYDINAVKRALGECLRNSKFMPTVSEVNDWINGGPLEDRARMAWSGVQEYIKRLRSDTSVRFADTASMWAVSACGGWVNLCRMPPEEAEPLFCKYYVTAARQNICEVPEHFAGQKEIYRGKIPDEGVITIPRVRKPLPALTPSEERKQIA